MRESEASNNKDRYDAFLSYSHRRDRQLARSFQRFLERFGTIAPWRRKVRIFRDETNLAAEPSLWDKLAKTIDVSRYFLLLASPESAQSAWVDKEIERYLAQKDLSGVIIVLTAGNTPWTDIDPNEAALAVSPFLLDAFKERGWEPLVIDLRGVTGRIQATPERLNQAASVVARLLGKEKDEVYGAHIAAQRMAILVLSGVVLLVAALAGVAVVQRQEAQENLARLKDTSRVMAASVAFESDPSEAGAILREVGDIETTADWYQRATEVARQPLTHRVYPGHDASIDETIADPSADLAISASQDGTVHFWRIHSVEPVYTIVGEGNVLFMRRFAKVGSLFVVWGDLYGGLIDLADLSRHQRFDLLPTVAPENQGFVPKPTDASLSPDERRLAVAYDTGLLRVYDVQSQRLVIEQKAPVEGHSTHTAVVQFTDDAHLVLSRSDGFDRLQLSNNSVKVHESLSLPRMVHAAKSAGGSWFAALTDKEVFVLRGEGLSIMSQFVRLQVPRLCCEQNHCSDPGFQAGRGVEFMMSMPRSSRDRIVVSRSMSLGHVRPSLSFSPTGETIALTEENGVALYGLHTNSASLLCGHRGNVRSLRFSPGGPAVLILA